MKKNKKKLVAAGFAFAIGVAAYFGVNVPPELQGPLAEMTCAVTGWC